MRDLSFQPVKLLDVTQHGTGSQEQWMMQGMIYLRDISHALNSALLFSTLSKVFCRCSHSPLPFSPLQAAVLESSAPRDGSLPGTSSVDTFPELNCTSWAERMGTPFFSSISMPGDSFKHPAKNIQKGQTGCTLPLTLPRGRPGAQPPGEDLAVWLPSSAGGFGAQAPVHHYV